MDIADIRRKAEEGHTLYQFLLGVRYCEGIGMAADHETGRKWVRVAADHGSARAALYLGEMYEKGIGMEQDHEKAFEYYQDAANKGEFMALLRLGTCYFYGRGTGINMDMAEHYFEKAMVKGDNIDKLALAENFETGYNLPKILKYAYVWYVLGQGRPGKIYALEQELSRSELESAKKLLAKIFGGGINP